MNKPVSALNRALPILLIASAAVPLLVIIITTRFPVDYWQPTVIYDLCIYLSAAAAGAVLLRLALPHQAGIALIVLTLTTFVLVIGILPMLAVLLLLMSSTVLGTGCLRWLLRAQTTASSDLAPPFFVGLALYLGLFSVLVHYPLNYRSVVLGILLLPLALLLLSGKWSALTRRVQQQLQQCGNGLHQLGYHWLVLQIMVLGFVASHAFFPTMGYDDHFLHLRLWTELSFRLQALFDFHSNVWILAPMLVDLQQALTSLVAGTDTRAALDLVWGGLLLLQLWQMLGRYLSGPGAKTLLLLLFASTPMLGNLLLGLQTELFTALLVTSGVRLLMTDNLRWDSETVLAVLAIAALCCATKLTSAVLGVLLLTAGLTVLISSRQLLVPGIRLRWLPVSLYMLMLSLLAFMPYAFAWHSTGNPVFPLFNAIFHSPYLDSSINLTDDRYLTGFSLNSFWDVFFGTSRHHEGQDYVAGFQYLLLLPLACMVAIARAGRKQWLPVLIPLLGFGVVMFASLQYWRYLFPVLPLASLLLAVLLQQTPESIRMQSRLAAPVALGSALLLNLYFYPGVSWIFQLSPLDAITEVRRARMLNEYATPAAINARLNATTHDLHVLYPQETGYGATLKGTPVYDAWYSPATFNRTNSIKTMQDLIGFMHDTPIDMVIWSLTEPMPVGSHKWWLGQYLSQYGFPEFQLANAIVYRVTDTVQDYHPLFALSQWQTTHQLPLQPIKATSEPRTLTNIDLHHARAARYNVNFRCDSKDGYFIAQLNWDNGGAYYHLLPCTGEAVNFSEALPIPAGANTATLYITARDRHEVDVTDLTLETR